MLARRFVAVLRSNARARTTYITHSQQTSLATRQAPFAARSYADERKPGGRAKRVEPKLDADGKPMRPKRLPAKKVKKVAKKPKGPKPMSDYQKKLRKNQIKKKAQKARKDRRDQDHTLALLDAPRNKAKLQAHTLFMKQALADMPAGSTSTFKKVNERWNALSDADKETWKTRADEYNAAVQEELEQWIKQHTPAEIRAANIAREALRKRFKQTGNFKAFKDDRAVKQPRSAYLLFGIEWRAQREKRSDVAKAMQEMAAEWRNLSSIEKQKYVDMAAEDKARYIREFESVYGYPPRGTGKSKKEAS